MDSCYDIPQQQTNVVVQTQAVPVQPFKPGMPVAQAQAMPVVAQAQAMPVVAQAQAMPMAQGP